MSELTTENCEAILAALHPAPSRLATDRALRDKLMYEAGVASVRLPAGSESLRALTLPARRSGVWSYSLASAAAAALLAVVVTRSVMAPPSTISPNVSEEVVELAEQSAHVDETHVEAHVETPVEATFAETELPALGAYASGSPWGIFNFPQGALLAQRNRILLEEDFRFPDPRDETDGFTDVSYTPPKTARELRAEYLPPRKETIATPSAWQWLTNWTQRGEEI